MTNVLVIKTSINGDEGFSNQLMAQFIEQFGLSKSLNITVRDLAKDELPHLNQTEMAAWMTPEEQRTDEQAALASLSDNVIEEIEQADIILIGMPMYNFGVPSTFKAWIDRLARAGKTFNYTENGPVGLLKDKPVYVFGSRGGFYAGTELDSQTPFVNSVLAFVGLTQVHYILAEGLATEHKESAISGANEKIVELIAEVVD